MLKKQLARFNHIMQGIEKIYEDYARSVGLTYMSLTVLEIIYYAEEPCTQKMICAQCHYNKQIVNAIVKGFLDKGYLQMSELASDRRNKQLMLTESGREYAGKILLPLWEIEQEALSVLSEDERDALLGMLGRCYAGYKAAWNEG
ncbi:MAG: winged helix-turn-helix transcriptional regulator [Clostridia bacterium]|nr:winged helix-turn-helix transcriptional regulator [Clostridia bacterium]